MELLEYIILSFSSIRGVGIGLPLGNLTSQLFVNVYMNAFDQWVKHTLRAQGYIRYADDFVIFSYNRERLAAQIPRIAEFLRDRLHLSLHPKKVQIHSVGYGNDFLGWVHFSEYRVLRSATKRRMLRRIVEHPTAATLHRILDYCSMEVRFDYEGRCCNAIGC